MHSAFYKGTAFNQDQQLWVPGEVLNMDNMFNGAIKFYQDISGWNVGKVTKSMECFTAM
jgi:surface protein